MLIYVQCHRDRAERGAIVVVLERDHFWGVSLDIVSGSCCKKYCVGDDQAFDISGAKVKILRDKGK